MKFSTTKHATAISIASIVLSGLHKDIHLKKPAISKKNVVMMFIEPVIERRIVIMNAVESVTIVSLNIGNAPNILNIKRKRPIQIPRMIISCCHVVSSWIPNMNFRNGFRIGGNWTSFARISSVLSSRLLPMAKGFVNLVSFGADRIRGVISRSSVNIIVPLFIFVLCFGCLNKFV